mmetsp:Transcript_30428/g.87237  ORF Transcript_30428/g.87237 Transcript_30428/m.87237 type:complete len:359 (-) Transcript_30428:383-1459(-)
MIRSRTLIQKHRPISLEPWSLNKQPSSRTVGGVLFDPLTTLRPFPLCTSGQEAGANFAREASNGPCGGISRTLHVNGGVHCLEDLESTRQLIGPSIPVRCPQLCKPGFLVRPIGCNCLLPVEQRSGHVHVLLVVLLELHLLACPDHSRTFGRPSLAFTGLERALEQPAQPHFRAVNERKPTHGWPTAAATLQLPLRQLGPLVGLVVEVTPAMDLQPLAPLHKDQGLRILVRRCFDEHHALHHHEPFEWLHGLLLGHQLLVLLLLQLLLPLLLQLLLQLQLLLPLLFQQLLLLLQQLLLPPLLHLLCSTLALNLLQFLLALPLQLLLLALLLHKLLALSLKLRPKGIQVLILLVSWRSS